MFSCVLHDPSVESRAIMWRLTRLPLRPIAALALPCAAVGYSQNEATVCSDHNDPIHDMLEHLYGDLALETGDADGCFNERIGF